MLKRWRARRQQALLEAMASKHMARLTSRRTPWADLDPLVRELVQIGRTSGFLERDGRRERTEEIGEQLYVSGGMSAMRSAHQEVSYWLPQEARSLEIAWDDIGDWRK